MVRAGLGWDGSALDETEAAVGAPGEDGGGEGESGCESGPHAFCAETEVEGEQRAEWERDEPVDEGDEPSGSADVFEAAEGAHGDDLHAVADLENSGDDEEGGGEADDGGIGSETGGENPAGEHEKERGERHEGDRGEEGAGGDVAGAGNFEGTEGVADADGEGGGESERDHEGGGGAVDRDLVGGERDVSEGADEDGSSDECAHFDEHLQAHGNADGEESGEFGFAERGEPADGQRGGEGAGGEDVGGESDEGGGAGDEGGDSGTFDAEGGAAEVAEDENPVEENVEENAAQGDPEDDPRGAFGFGEVFEAHAGEGGHEGPGDPVEVGRGDREDFGWLAEKAVERHAAGEEEGEDCAGNDGEEEAVAEGFAGGAVVFAAVGLGDLDGDGDGDAEPDDEDEVDDGVGEGGGSEFDGADASDHDGIGQGDEHLAEVADDDREG